MIIGMMTGGGAPAGEFWFFGPIAENGAAGGSQAFYLRTSDPANWSVGLRPRPAGLSSITRISSANGAVFMFGSAGEQVVSFNAGASWTVCTGLTQNNDRDVFWNGSFYYHENRRSSNGVAWEAIPNLPANTTIRLARQSDGLVVGWQTSTGFQTTLDNGANWTLRTGIYTNPSNMATDGARITFNISDTVGYYTDDAFATATAMAVGGIIYSTYCDGVNFVAKSTTGLDPVGVRSIGLGASVGAITLNEGWGGANAANIVGQAGLFVFASNQAGTPILNEIYLSTDGGLTWGLSAGLYGNGQNIASNGQRP